MFASHEDVSNMSCVEDKRETIAIATVMENMNIDNYHRRKTQDRTMKLSTKHAVFERITNT